VAIHGPNTSQAGSGPPEHLLASASSASQTSSPPMPGRFQAAFHCLDQSRTPVRPRRHGHPRTGQGITWRPFPSSCSGVSRSCPPIPPCLNADAYRSRPRPGDRSVRHEAPPSSFFNGLARSVNSNREGERGFRLLWGTRGQAAEQHGVASNSETRVVMRVTRVFRRKTRPFRIKVSGGPC
jgi:hypothetical protein